MKTADVLAHFNNDSYEVADALDITRQAVEQWGRVVPQGSAYKLEVLTKGKLKVNPADYEKAKSS